MPGLDLSVQLAVQALLKEIKGFHGKTWAEIGSKEKLGEDDAVLTEMAKTKKDGHPGKIISKEFALKLIRYCKSKEEHGFTFTKEIIAGLDHLWEHYEGSKTAKDRSNEEQNNAPSASFISALGINETVAQRSIKNYSGEYLHFALNEHEAVVTTRCHLSGKLGEDGAPIFSSVRHYEDEITIESIGAYFCSEQNLYLIASPTVSVDLRLSVFNVTPGKYQEIIRGMMLGVTRGKIILSTRCILVTKTLVDKDIEASLWEVPTARQAFSQINNYASELSFSEVSAFLFGEESVDDYIKLITPPG